METLEVCTTPGCWPGKLPRLLCACLTPAFPQYGLGASVYGDTSGPRQRGWGGGSLKGVILPIMALKSKAVILIQVCLDYRMSLRSSWVITEHRHTITLEFHMKSFHCHLLTNNHNLQTGGLIYQCAPLFSEFHVKSDRKWGLGEGCVP